MPQHNINPVLSGLTRAFSIAQLIRQQAAQEDRLRLEQERVNLLQEREGRFREENQALAQQRASQLDQAESRFLIEMQGKARPVGTADRIEAQLGHSITPRQTGFDPKSRTGKFERQESDIRSRLVKSPKGQELVLNKPLTLKELEAIRNREFEQETQRGIDRIRAEAVPKAEAAGLTAAAQAAAREPGREAAVEQKQLDDERKQQEKIATEKRAELRQINKENRARQDQIDKEERAAARGGGIAGLASQTTFLNQLAGLKRERALVEEEIASAETTARTGIITDEFGDPAANKFGFFGPKKVTPEKQATLQKKVAILRKRLREINTQIQQAQNGFNSFQQRKGSAVTGPADDPIETRQFIRPTR